MSDEQIHGNKLLHDKVAVIFGAGGATGSSVNHETDLFHEKDQNL
jgi:hypothetical protein